MVDSKKRSEGEKEIALIINLLQVSKTTTIITPIMMMTFLCRRASGLDQLFARQRTPNLTALSYPL